MSYGNDDRAYEQQREAQQQPQQRRLSPAEAARIQKQQDDNFLRKRYGQKFLDDRDAHNAAVAKSAAATRERAEAAKLKPLLDELNRSHQQLYAQQQEIALADEKMRLQSEKSDWNPGPPYVPQPSDTPLIIQRKAEAAMAAFGELDRDAQKVLIGFMQVNPCDLTNPAVWESAWSFICKRLTPPEPEPLPVPEPVAVVEPEPVCPFQYGSREAERWDREQYQKEFDRESAIFRQAVESLGTDLSGAEVKRAYESYLNYVQATAKVSGRPREAFTLQNVTQFLKQFFAGRDSAAVAEAAEYEKSLDASTYKQIRDHVGVNTNYKPVGGNARRA